MPASPDPLAATGTHQFEIGTNADTGIHVKSRMVINLLYKNLRAFLLPLLERLNGRDMAQGTLGDVMVVDLPVVEEGLFEILG